jgi:hypothetical protein
MFCRFPIGRLGHDDIDGGAEAQASPSNARAEQAATTLMAKTAAQTQKWKRCADTALWHAARREKAGGHLARPRSVL